MILVQYVQKKLLLGKNNRKLEKKSLFSCTVRKKVLLLHCN